jgi:hypothetical protein
MYYLNTILSVADERTVKNIIPEIFEGNIIIAVRWYNKKGFFENRISCGSKQF